MSRSKPQSLNDRSDRLLGDISSRNRSIEGSEPVEKPLKVKIEGRRRLCKVSSQPPEEPSDAPPESPVPQIRDILNNLTSRLETLSIKKRKPPQTPFSSFTLLSESDSANSSYLSAAGSTDAGDGVGESKGKERALSPVNLDSAFVDEEDCVVSGGNEWDGDEGDMEKGEKSVASSDNGEDYPEKEVAKGKEKRVVSTSDRGDDGEKKAVKGKGKSVVSISDGAEDAEKVVAKGDKKGVVLVDDDDDDEEKELAEVEHKNVISLHDVEDVDDAESLNSSDGDDVRLSNGSLTYTLPGKIAKMLYQHQRDGLKWLWSLHCKRTGGILGDDMGLGKTMQISAFLAGLFHSNMIKRALVVAPKTLLAHWIKELSVVGLSEKIREYYGACMKARQYELQYILQDKGVLLTTYDIVRNNFKSLQADSYYHDDESEDGIIWDYIILDEGHIIKNPSTQRAKSLLELRSMHRIIISGTPIQNNLKELWALFHFCCPGLLGEKKEFKEKYECRILRGNDKNATAREKRIGSEVAKALREHIKPCFLRRLKSEVFHDGGETKSTSLSKKHDLIVWLRLTECQRRLYEAFLNSELVLSSFDGSPLAALTILKKICDHPLLLTKKAAEGVLEGMETMNHADLHMVEDMALRLASMTTPKESPEMQANASCKITFILSLLENLVKAGHYVLIFSQTRKMLNIIQEEITLKGYTFLRIDGTTKACEREKIVKEFQEGEGAPIFLLTSQVGGLGLTLTKADRVIVVDPAWNPSTDNQSVDRAYRIGQNKDVVVYRLMTCGTIEEKIYRMQIFKGGLFKTATEHKEQTRYFSKSDLQELFSLPKQGFDVSLTQQQLHEEHDHQHKTDNLLKAHIKFLENQGIAGVSNHNLVFSKTAILPPPEEDEMLIREKTNAHFGPSSSYSVKRNVDGADFAFNPKDKDKWRRDAFAGSWNVTREDEIKSKIARLHQLLGDKSVVSQLPDGGEKIRRQIEDLNLELHDCEIKSSRLKDNDVIDLDDISGRMEKLRTE